MPIPTRTIPVAKFGWLGLLIALLFSASDISSQPRAAMVEFRQVTFFSDPQFASLINFNPERSYTPFEVEQLLQRMIRVYLEQGFAPAISRRDSLADSTLTVIFDIREGHRHAIARIGFAGHAAFTSSELEQDLSLAIDNYCTSELLLENLKIISQKYTNAGFPFVTVIPRLQLSASGLEIIFRIEENGRFYIGAIQRAAGMRTTEKFLQRQMGIQPGDLFRESRLDAAENRLNRLTHVSQVRALDLVIIAPDTLAIVVDLVERQVNQGEGVIGYVPRRGETKGYFNGYVRLRFNNLFGGGRRIGVYWNKPQQEREDIELSYSQPWILGSPLAAGISFVRAVWDTVSTNSTMNLELSLELWHNLTFYSVGYRSRGQEILSSNARVTTTKLGLQWGIRYDNRDYPLNPRSGIDYDVQWGWGRRSFHQSGQSADTSAERTIQLRLDHYFPIRRRLIFFAGGSLHRYQGQDEGDIPEYDRYPLGGANSLRGYEEQQFRGIEVGLVKLESRYLLTRRSRVFLFLDAGHYQQGQWDDPLIGYGAGVRLDAKIGLIGLDYGLGEGDSLTNGKLHFGWQSEF